MSRRRAQPQSRRIVPIVAGRAFGPGEFIADMRFQDARSRTGRPRRRRRWRRCAQDKGHLGSLVATPLLSHFDGMKARLEAGPSPRGRGSLPKILFRKPPFREPTEDALLRRTVFFRPTTAVGQKPPPSLVAGGDRCSSVSRRRRRKRRPKVPRPRRGRAGRCSLACAPLLPSFLE